MKTGILREFSNELQIETQNGIFRLCKGSEQAIRDQKEKFLDKEINFVLLPSNKAVVL